MCLLVCDGRQEDVMNNDNLVRLVACISDKDSHRHNSRVVHGSGAMRNGSLENVGEWPGETSAALFSNREDLPVSTILADEHLLAFTDDSGVDGTAETLVGSDRDEESLRISDLSRHLTLHEGVGLEDHVQSISAEVLTTLESGEILLELRRRDHLHRLGDLTNVLDRLHTNLKHLLTRTEVSHISVVEERWASPLKHRGSHVYNYY